VGRVGTEVLRLAPHPPSRRELVQPAPAARRTELVSAGLGCRSYVATASEAAEASGSSGCRRRAWAQAVESFCSNRPVR
jgi:hypothetical protein